MMTPTLTLAPHGIQAQLVFDYVIPRCLWRVCSLLLWFLYISLVTTQPLFTTNKFMMRVGQVYKANIIMCGSHDPQIHPLFTPCL